MGVFDSIKDSLIAVAVIVVAVIVFLFFKKISNVFSVTRFKKNLKVANKKDATETLRVLEESPSVSPSRLSPGKVLVTEVVNGQNVTFKFDAKDLEKASFYERNLLKKGASIASIVRLSSLRQKLLRLSILPGGVFSR